jgi:choline dehydrogenase-like flavoprotein
MAEILNRQADVVVVGSGPGGATVARQLSRAGKRVVLLERGHDHRGRPYYGSHLGALIYADKNSLYFTDEGLNIVRPIMTGGATNMFCGAAARPPDWFKGKYGVDIARYVEETIDELRIAPLPRELRGAASERVMETAVDLGYDWQPLMKFMNPVRAARFDCGAKCMLGCRCGAKWTANEYVDDAVAAGCELITGARVDRVIIEDGHVRGVLGKVGRKQPFDVRAEVVVLAAGGIGTPLIMQNSGFFEAGNGSAMDVTVMVYGVSKERGNAFEPPMTVAYFDDENGYVLSTLIDPWFLYPVITTLKSPKYTLTTRNYRNTLGLMIKIKDDISGSISMEGRISKPMTPRDQYRLNHAAIVCRKILVKAGCDPDSIFVSPQRGTHPSCTVRIGEMLDTNLQTEVKNLYACDASTFPEALDRPTVLTIIGLGKRLSDHLMTTTFRREIEVRREPVAPAPAPARPEPEAVASEPLSVFEPPAAAPTC